jgi:hypothetical protein
MPHTLQAFLRKQAERNLAYLLREAEAVSEVDAFRGRRPDWPDQKWGIGQDGSIAGIAYHVAAWKQLTLPLFAPDGKAFTRADFDAGTAPGRDNWPGIVNWLRQIGTDWNAALGTLPDADFDAERKWDGGARITISQYVSEMIQHDVQHAAQIEYLRQVYAADSASAPSFNTYCIVR